MYIAEKAGVKGTRVRIYKEGTDILLNEGHNITTLAGAGLLTRKLFESLSTDEEITPSYNTTLGLENTIETAPTSPEYIYLFAIGTSGCGKEPHDLYKEEYADWIQPEDLIPFKYNELDMDIADSLRDTYFGRSIRTNKIAYYFKRPENMDAPEKIQQYVDGTPIDSSVYRSTRKDDAITRVGLHMKVTKDEARQFFYATTGINTARVNCISVLTAWPRLIDGKIYYQNIRPFTRYNFNTIPLIDPELGLDIKYDFFF